MLKIDSTQPQKQYSDSSSNYDRVEELDRGQNVKNFDIHKAETGKKFDFDTPTKIDFEKMTPAERRRLNFKKAGTKAFQPHLMKNIKKDKLNHSTTFIRSASDDGEP